MDMRRRVVKGVASRRWWDTTRRDAARAAASSADMRVGRGGVGEWWSSRGTDIFLGAARSACEFLEIDGPNLGALRGAIFVGTPTSPMGDALAAPPARRGRIESALLAPGVSRAVEYHRDAEHHGVSPFEDLARLARRLDALRDDDDDDDDAEDSSDVDARLAAAWTAARRAAEGRAELRPALTLLAQCMERRANVAAARREERETCARELLATVNEMRDRVESALDEEGLLEPARRAWSAARSSPDASPQPTAAHVVASPPEEFEEDVAAIDADRRRVSALPAPLGITPPVLAPEPEMEDKRVGRRRREAAAQETDERVRKQRRDFSFDLVTPTLSTTPEEEDEDAIRRDENQNQNQNQNQTKPRMRG